MTDLDKRGVLFRIVAIATILFIARYPNEYRRAMARLCSVDPDDVPPYPRSLAIALAGFLALTLIPDVYHMLSR